MTAMAAVIASGVRDRRGGPPDGGGGYPAPKGMRLVGVADIPPAGACAAVAPVGVGAAVASAAQAGAGAARWIARLACADGAGSNLGRSSNAVRWGLGIVVPARLAGCRHGQILPDSLNWTVGGSIAWGLPISVTFCRSSTSPSPPHRSARTVASGNGRDHVVLAAQILGPRVNRGVAGGGFSWRIRLFDAWP